jgi:hypothetical protein
MQKSHYRAEVLAKHIERVPRLSPKDLYDTRIGSVTVSGVKIGKSRLY